MTGRLGEKFQVNWSSKKLRLIWALNIFIFQLAKNCSYIPNWFNLSKYDPFTDYPQTESYSLNQKLDNLTNLNKN